MKKLITALVLLVILVCAFSIVSFAASMEVNGVAYEGTLKQAIDAAPTNGTLYTIKLLEDVDFDIALASGSSGQNVVVDLNGKTINFKATMTLRKGTYTFKNGTFEGPNKFNASSTSYVIVLDGNTSYERNVTLNLENVTINSNRFVQIKTKDANDNHTMNLTDVTFNGPDANTLFYSDGSAAVIEVNIYSGTFNGPLNTNYIKGIDNFNVYGGTYTASDISNYIDKDNYEVINNQNGTYTVKKIEVVLEKQPEKIVFENFENSPLFSKTSVYNQRIGVGGQAKVDGDVGLFEIDNAKSGSYVSGYQKKHPYLSSGTFKSAVTYRIKFYNMFGLETKTPVIETSTWPHGWEMFTEDDIGKEFEISLWVYADSKDGAFPYVGGNELEDFGFISGDDLDITNEDTKPSVTVGLYGPNSSSDDAQTYKYGATPFIEHGQEINWDEWTEIKVHYTVTKDSIYDATQSKNPLVNTIAVNNQARGSGYYPSTLYIDDVTVKELSMHPNILLVSEDKVLVDVKIPSALVDTSKKQMVIASVYDKNTNNIVSAKSFDKISSSILTCELDVNFDTEMVIKFFMWDGNTFLPLLKNEEFAIPSLNELKNSVKIDRISQTFYGDVYTQKGFNWYSRGLLTSQIAYVEKTGDTPDWSKAKYETATSQYMRYDSVLAEHSATMQRAVAKNLKPNTEYFYKLGNKEFDVWSDTYTFKTADNTTNDAFIYVTTDPQTEMHYSAKEKGKMMEYVYEKHPGGEFILNGGDLTISSMQEEEWVYTFNENSFATPNITFMGAPGNHDVSMSPKVSSVVHTKMQPWGKHFNILYPEERTSEGKSFYSFDYKDMHIAVLDTNMMPYDVNTDIEQIPWLIKDMQNTDKKWKIVLLHFAPQSTLNGLVTSTTDNIGYLFNASIMPILSDLGVDLVLSGHTHLYSRTYPIKGLGGVLNETTGAVEKFDDEPGLGNPDAKYTVKEFNGRDTKFFDATEGVTYLTLGSVSAATSADAFNPDTKDPSISLIPSYDVVIEETGCTPNDLTGAGYSTYNTMTVTENDIIISVYQYDLNDHEKGSWLFDQFAITKE